MLKIILGLLVVVISMFVGYVLSKKYRQRRRFLTQFREFNEQFINEITYYRRPIKAFMEKQTFEGEFHCLLQSYVAWLEQYTEKRGEGLDLSPYTFLTESEKVDVYDYFMTLGKGDCESQKRYFLSMRERLIKYEANAILQGKKYENLYIELGFLCGLFILILII